MTMYKVVWTMDLDAESPEEAARLALQVHRDPESIATCFDVTEWGGSDSEHFDLTELDQAASNPDCLTLDV